MLPNSSSRYCRRLASPFVAVLACLLLAACGGGSSAPKSTSSGNSRGSTTPPALSFQQTDTLGLLVGDTKSDPASGPGTGAITYSSSDTSIATVDSSGNVTAVAPGSATITARQAADANYAASTTQVTANVIADTFTMTAWLGKSDTKVDFTAGMDGVNFIRSTDASCDLANYSLCANGQMDVLAGTTVTDTAANANRSAFYNLINGSARTQIPIGPYEVTNATGSNAVAFNGKLYVIGGFIAPYNGSGDDVWVSSDGSHWALLTDNGGFPERNYFSIAVYDNKIWIAGGKQPGPTTSGNFDDTGSDVWSSPDGINWMEATATAAFGKLSGAHMLAFNGKLWLLKGAVWSSTDGKTWTQALAALPFTLRDVVVLNNKMYAATEKGMWSSSDGENWTQITAAAGYYRADGLGVLDGKLWVTSYSPTASTVYTNIWTSPDGITWTKQPVVSGFDYRYLYNVLGFQGKLFVLGGGMLFGAPLTDQWYLENNVWHRDYPGADFPARLRQSGVAFNNKLWVIAGKTYGSNYLNDVWSSADGITWTEEIRNAAFSPRDGQQVVEYNGKLWLYGGENAAGPLSDEWSSPDGINWTAETADPLLATRKEYGMIVFNNTLWMLGGIKTSDGSYLNEVWHSTDGINWTQDSGSNFPTRARMGLTVYNGELWMVGGETASNTYASDAWHSSDGVNWTQATAATGNLGGAWPQLYAIGGKLFVTSSARQVATTGSYVAATPITLWSTTNGVNWTEEDADTVYQVFSNPVVTFNGNVWMLGGANSDWYMDYDYRNTVWRSTDGVHWRMPIEASLNSPD